MHEPHVWDWGEGRQRGRVGAGRREGRGGLGAASERAGARHTASGCVTGGQRGDLLHNSSPRPPGRGLQELPLPGRRGGRRRRRRTARRARGRGVERSVVWATCQPAHARADCDAPPPAHVLTMCSRLRKRTNHPCSSHTGRRRPAGDGLDPRQPGQKGRWGGGGGQACVPLDHLASRTRLTGLRAASGSSRRARPGAGRAPAVSGGMGPVRGHAGRAVQAAAAFPDSRNALSSPQTGDSGCLRAAKRAPGAAAMGCGTSTAMSRTRASACGRRCLHAAMVVLLLPPARGRDI